MAAKWFNSLDTNSKIDINVFFQMKKYNDFTIIQELFPAQWKRRQLFPNRQNKNCLKSELSGSATVRSEACARPLKKARHGSRNHWVTGEQAWKRARAAACLSSSGPLLARLSVSYYCARVRALALLSNRVRSVIEFLINWCRSSIDDVIQ